MINNMANILGFPIDKGPISKLNNKLKYHNPGLIFVTSITLENERLIEASNRNIFHFKS